LGRRIQFRSIMSNRAGATGVVSALHLYRGEAWPLKDVLKEKAEVEAAGLIWSVVESIPVHNSIKLHTGSFRQFTDAWKDSLAAASKAGISNRKLEGLTGTSGFPRAQFSHRSPRVQG
jgi:D-mannonate dehydratase